MVACVSLCTAFLAGQNLSVATPARDQLGGKSQTKLSTPGAVSYGGPKIIKIDGYKPTAHPKACPPKQVGSLIQHLMKEQAFWGWRVAGPGKQWGFGTYQSRMIPYWKAYDSALNGIKRPGTSKSKTWRTLTDDYYVEVSKERSASQRQHIYNYSMENVPPNQVLIALSDLALTRCNEVADIADKTNVSDKTSQMRRWTIADLILQLTNLVAKKPDGKTFVVNAQPRMIALDAWGYNDKVKQFEKLAVISEALLGSKRDCAKINKMSADIKKILKAEHSKALLDLCSGKLGTFPTVQALRAASKKADRPKFKNVTHNDVARRKAKIEQLKAEIAEMKVFRCESSDSMLSVMGALEYDNEVLEDPKSSKLAKLGAFLSAGIIRQSKLAEYECSSQKLGWDSTGIMGKEGHLRRLTQDSLGLFLNGVNVVSSIYAVGGANPVADMVTMVVEPAAGGINKANGTCVEFPKGTQIVGYGIDGLGMVKHMSSEMLKKGFVTVYLTVNKGVAKDVLKEMTGGAVDYAVSKGTVYAIEKMSTNCVNLQGKGGEGE